MHRSHRLAAGVLAAAVALIAGVPPGAMGATPAPAEPVLAPGTYAQIAPGTKRPAKIGNTVVFVRGKTGGLAFSVNAIRALDLNQGFVAGILYVGNRHVHQLTWVQKGGGTDCRLTFTATPTGLTIQQDLKFGDCGFGYGVVADGDYVRVSDHEKLGLPPGP
jgi:hypothetical protein